MVAMRVMISQPMFFPWIGLFEQIMLSDLYIHLDDVQMPGGQSFVHRVQLKGPNGSFWWNAPMNKPSLQTAIRDVSIDITSRWKRKSRTTLEQILSGEPFIKDALDLFDLVVSHDTTSLSLFNIHSIEAIAQYLELKTHFKTIHRNELSNDKTENIIEILVKEKADSYLSALGGLNYLDQNVFDKNNIKLLYMEYKKQVYPQKYGIFDPYVSILHPIAALGKDSRQLLLPIKKEGFKNGK